MSNSTVAMGHAGGPDLDLLVGRCPDAALDASSTLPASRPLVLDSPLSAAASTSKGGRASQRLPVLSSVDPASACRSEDAGAMAGSMLLSRPLTMLLPSAKTAATPLSPVAPSTGSDGAGSSATEPFSLPFFWTVDLLLALG